MGRARSVLGRPKGTFSFLSRTGGVWGTHTYEMGIGAESATAGDGGSTAAPPGAGYVKRDGTDFPAVWTVDGGQHASDWANEIYDGIMATYSPGSPAVADCVTTPSTNYVGSVQTYAADSCLVLEQAGASSFLGVRPLGFYMTFNVGTNQVTSMYCLWLGGTPDCWVASTEATREYIDYASVGFGELAEVQIARGVTSNSGLTA